MASEPVVILGDRTVAVWSVSCFPGVDFWAHLGYSNEGKLELQCRIRTQVDDLVFDSKDKKTWYIVHADKERGESDMLERSRAVYKGMLARSTSNQGWELLKGARSTYDFLKLLESMPGMYISKEPIRVQEPDHG